jgi:hypothetical protein
MNYEDARKRTISLPFDKVRTNGSMVLSFFRRLFFALQGEK